MAESMKGLHRSHRCAEVVKRSIGSRSNCHGLGTEKKKSWWYDLY